MFFENQESSDTGDFYIDEVLIKDANEVPPDSSEIVPLQVNGDAETGDTAGWAVSTGGGERATISNLVSAWRNI